MYIANCWTLLTCALIHSHMEIDINVNITKKCTKDILSVFICISNFCFVWPQLQDLPHQYTLLEGRLLQEVQLWYQFGVARYLFLMDLLRECLKFFTLWWLFKSPKVLVSNWSWVGCTRSSFYVKLITFGKLFD